MIGKEPWGFSYNPRFPRCIRIRQEHCGSVAPVSWSTWSFGRSRMGRCPKPLRNATRLLTLADIYAVIAYYLRHQEDLDAYLDAREQQAREVRQRIQHHQGDLAGLRSRLRARRAR